MLSGLSSFIDRHTSWRSFLVLLVLFVAAYAVFFYAPIPFGLSAIHAFSGGLNVPDVEFHLTAAQIYARLDRFGESGRATYATILTADMFYVAVYGSFYAVAVALAQSAAGRRRHLRLVRESEHVHHPGGLSTPTHAPCEDNIARSPQ